MKISRTLKLLCTCLLLLAGLAGCACAAAPVKTVRGQAGAGEVSFAKEEAKRLDVFFSNFAEAGLPFFALDAASREDLLNFGVEHVLINNLSALRSVGGSYAVPADRVKSAVKKYFGRELTPSATKRFPFKDGCFIAPQASGEAYKFAQIVDMTPAGGGLFKATVKLYTASSGFTGDSHGTPQQWRKSSTEDVPAESGVVRALISRSRIEPGRYFLRAYQQAR